MKKGLILIVLACIAIAYISCEKPTDSNYRENYVGTYDFTTIDTTRQMVQLPEDSLYSCKTTSETINYMGIVEKYGNNRLKITFKPNANEPDFISDCCAINGLIYPIVNEHSTLTYPEFSCTDRGGFDGWFSSDSIIIRYGQTIGHGWYEFHEIKGIKISNKINIKP